MNDPFENRLTMLHAVHQYLATPAAALLLSNTIVAARRDLLADHLAAIAAHTGSETTRSAESGGATAGKKAARTALSNLLLKVAKGTESCFLASGDVEGAAAVRLTATRIRLTRDQALPALITLVLEKATSLGSSLAVHNVSSADLAALSADLAAWHTTSSRPAARRAAASASRAAALARITEACTFLRTQLDPLIHTFRLSADEPSRTAAVGYFSVRTIHDLRGRRSARPPAPGG